MSRHLFGTDGIRAKAGEPPLDDETIVRIGRAVGTEFAKVGESIVIACDTRESSKHIVETIAAGLQQVGVQAVFAGVMPTPGIAHITSAHDEFVAGVMVTASHNPYEYNGIKVFTADGGKLPDATEERITAAVETGVASRDSGSYVEQDLRSEFVKFLVQSAGGQSFSGLKLALDTANGAASGLAEDAFTQLGADIVAFADDPDGRNINQSCGATDTNTLKELVLREHCDLGIAVDGDADRCIMVDHLGRECNGDYLLYILAVSHHFDRIVATVMSNLGTEISLQKQGVALERTAVGDRYVLERLLETGLPLGGEQSGHIIIPSLTTTGDGLLSAIQVIKALKDSGRTLAEWRDDVIQLPQALVNIPLDDKTKLSRPDVNEYITEQTEQLGENGRLLIRPSGTEPLVRVMVEANDAEQTAETIAKRLKEMLA